MLGLSFAVAACGDDTEGPDAEITRFEDSIATSHRTAAGLETTLTDLAGHPLAIVEYDVVQREAAMTLPVQGMTSL